MIAVGSYLLASTLLKFSLAIFFLRLAYRRWQRFLVIGTAIFYVPILLAFITTFFAQCGFPVPLDFLSRNCQARAPWVEPLNYTFAAYSVLSDWIFTLSPVLHVWQSKRIRGWHLVSIIGLILLGVLGSIAAIIRIPYLPDSRLGPQVLWTQGKVLTLLLSEVALGTTAISLATIKPLLARWSTRLSFTRGRPAGLKKGAINGQFKQPGWKMMERELVQPGTMILGDATAFKNLGVLPDVSFDESYEESFSSSQKSDWLEEPYTTAKSKYLETISEIEPLGQIGLLDASAEREQSFA